MKRREFVEKLGMGSAGLAAAAALTNSRAEAAGPEKAQHDHVQVDGPLSQATVSFGQWKTDPPLDRFTVAPPPSANNHHLIPYVATVKAGGAVNFLLSGLHLVLVYAPGTTLAELQDALNQVPAPVISPTLPFGGFLDVAANRVYRGLNPVGLTPDRVEAVTFPEKGTYLVVCGIVAHLRDNMHGFVKVV